MRKTLAAALRKLQRDQDLPLSLRLAKIGRYAWEVAVAPLYLHAVDEVGQGVRTHGRPRIENLGSMRIGAGTLLRSVNVPVELATGVGAALRIGRDCNLNYGVSVGCTGRIDIGDRVRVGPYAMIVDTDFHDPYNRQIRPPARPVSIEDDVWVGAKACVMAGVTLGRGAIVGTGAVVTRDVPAFHVVAGVPAKVIRQLDPTRFTTPEAP